MHLHACTHVFAHIHARARTEMEGEREREREREREMKYQVGREKLHLLLHRCSHQIDSALMGTES